MMTPKEFEACVEEGIRSVPGRFRRLLENVVIVVEEEPSTVQRAAMLLEGDDTLLGLYEGVSRDRRDSSYGGALPDTITLFRKPILAMARSREEVRKIVRETVWHEVAHYFGMDEDEVEAAEGEREALEKENE